MFNQSKIKPAHVNSAVEYSNLNYLFSLFRYRSIERNLSAAKEFNDYVTNDVKFEEAFNLCSNEILKATQAHCYYIIMFNFINKVKEMEDTNIQKALTRLCIVFDTTHFLDENWGDIIEQNQYSMIRTTAYNVMSESRNDCITLTDEFDYPDKVLKSTIGRHDGNVYESLFDAAQKSTLNRTDPTEAEEIIQTIAESTCQVIEEIQQRR